MRSQFLILAVFLGACLLSLFLQYLLKRGQSYARQDIDPKTTPDLPREPTPPASRVMPSRATPLPTAAPLAVPHQRTPSRLGSLRDVRRGMVLMTILGPCRALEPPELQSVSQPNSLKFVDDRSD